MSPTVRTFLLAVPALALAIAALAAEPPSWTPGVPAKNAARVLSPMPSRIVLALPEDLQKQIHGKTLLVYFSPTCPHCKAAAPEIAALATRLKGQMDVIAIANGRATQDQVDAFAKAYGWTFPVLIDDKGLVATALSVNSTPSVALVEPEKKASIVIDFWYPYVRGYDTLVAMRVLAKPWDAFVPGEYQGNALCGACHPDEIDSWGITHHAVAWHSLDRSGKTADPACTSCHVTGSGAPGGWDGSAESPLVDVGCEACHGPGGPHAGAKVDPKTQCANCHDDKHSIAFNVDQAVPILDHYRASAMKDGEWSDLRSELWDGKVPRTMLAFPAGPTVGAAACAECHADQHTAWASSAHAHAMEILPEDKRGDVDCVKCHATATASGPAPSTIEGYRTTEGVACESCHGPGKAHVDSKGAPGTIEGLGADCPVCVVEAMCTTCHTPEQDKDWNLDRDLPLAGHSAAR